MKERGRKKQKQVQKIKTYFLIVNLIISIIAFSCLISASYPLSVPLASESSGSGGSLVGKYVQTIASGGTTKILKISKVDGDSIIGTYSDGTQAQILNYFSEDQATSISSGLTTVSKETNDLWGNLNPADESIISISKSKIKSITKLPGGGERIIYENGGYAEYNELRELVSSSKTGTGSWSGGIGEYFKKGFIDDFQTLALWGGIGAAIGTFAGGKQGTIRGTIAGLAGAVAKGIATQAFGAGNAVFGGTGPWLNWITPGWLGIGVAVIVFALLYEKESTKIVEFNCLPYEPPIGGKNCDLCNKFEECTEYTCKSLGQACTLVPEGNKCVWVNPHDTIAPRIEVIDVIKGHKFVPDTNLAPSVRGVVITQENGGCIKAFTPLEFTINTKDENGKDEPSQCKIDYNLINVKEDNIRGAFDNMAYYVGGSNLYNYTHIEKLSLPGPNAINEIAPELKNDGAYTLYLRCQDANGNFNEAPYSVRFCVEKGPDTTPPRIEEVSIPSNSPILYNQSNVNLEVYLNEPAECKWSKDDKSYENMENKMACEKNIWDMNKYNLYTCLVTLTGIESRQENDFYFRCKDQPNSEESNRNVNTQSYLYTLIGTRPLNILSVGPNETIYGSTDTIPIELSITTDNGYENGDSTCYYSVSGEEKDYIEFLETGTNVHKQRQDLPTRDYTYYFKCVDLAGNAEYNSTSFRVETDNSGPSVVRAYKESGELKIITNEKTECSYSFNDCNFEIDDGIKMSTSNFINHNTEWSIKTYYVRCKDKYNNQPNPNECSIVVRPFEISDVNNAIAL